MLPVEKVAILLASQSAILPSVMVRNAMKQVKRPWRKVANCTPIPAMSGSDLMHDSACVVDLFSVVDNRPHTEEFCDAASEGGVAETAGME